MACQPLDDQHVATQSPIEAAGQERNQTGAGAATVLAARSARAVPLEIDP